MNEVEYKATVTNFKNFGAWEYKNYPLCEKEALICADALEKRIAVKPVFNEVGSGEAAIYPLVCMLHVTCPACSRILPKETVERKAGYCCWCGQKLDWSNSKTNSVDQFTGIEETSNKYIDEKEKAVKDSLNTINTEES